MRRRSWEEGGGDDEFVDPDQPVTLTGRQLKSLKMGAMLGTIALVLAVIAIGAAAYTMFSAPKKAAVPENVAATPAPAQADSAATHASSMTPEPTAATSTASAAPAATPPATKVASAPAGAGAVIPKTHAAASTHRASHPKREASNASAPKMESFDSSPSPASPPPAASIPTPVPIPVEHKAAADTSKH